MIARRRRARKESEKETDGETGCVASAHAVQWRFNEVSSSLIAALVYDCSGRRASRVVAVSDLAVTSSFDLPTTPPPPRQNVKWDNKQRKTWKSYQWKIGLTAGAADGCKFGVDLGRVKR